MNLKPLNDRIIIRREASNDKSPGGIIIPEAAKQKPQRGTILAVGPGKLNRKTGVRIPLDVKVGDVVLFTSWAGDEFKDKKSTGEVLIMVQDDVMAIIG